MSLSFNPQPLPQLKARLPEALKEVHAAFKVIMGAYRALAKINHPDVGGEKERMQEINRALQEAKARI
jgi:hypothetical protein